MPAARSSHQDAQRPISPFFNKDALTEKYSGWLPHWRQASKLYFVTFRLNDSVAQDRLRAWTEENRIWLSCHPQPWSDHDWKEYHERFTERMEAFLDAGYGSCVLALPDIGKLTEDALHHFDGNRYRLGDYVVMPNHVHVLVQPAGDQDLSSILHSWKSFTAKQANQLRGTSGAFWQDEYFDHLVRSEAQYNKFCRYILENPSQANLPPTRYRLGKGTFALQRAPGVGSAEPNAQCALEIQSPIEPTISARSAGKMPAARAQPTCCWRLAGRNGPVGCARTISPV